MSPWLKSLSALAKNPVWAHKQFVITVPSDSVPFSGLHSHQAHTHGAHMYMQTKHTYKINM